MRTVKFIIFLLFGLMFINSGLNKLFHYLPTPELSEELTKIDQAFNTISWLLPLVGIVEVIGGILSIIPRTRALGMIVLFPIMIGIMCQHIYYAPEGLLYAGIFFVINLWGLFDNKDKYRPLIL